MKYNILYMAILCWAVVFSGVTPELHALNVGSSAGMNDEQTGSSGCASPLSANTQNISAEEISHLIPDFELQNNAEIKIQGGGYYTSSSSSNQYSSFFGNAEAFLTELVEFFLFLALLSYVVGYEEWLPWEKEDK